GLLADPACRLLTLVGPGGIGKTRLALQAATMLGDSAPRVVFVDLAPVRSLDLFVSAIADPLHVPLSGQASLQAQLLNLLSDKEILLLLDNLEHLLAEDFGASDITAYLTALLQAAPGVKLLVTSRESLNLQGEWLYPVGGLPFPLSLNDEALDSYGAVQLFATCARRVRPDFALEEEAEGVIQICQLVEGLPLALELAASWAKSLRCEVIAAEIRHSLDFLTARLRDMPERHRSMRAAFDQSWQRLSAQERHIFKRLSIFRGGFRRAAAQQVANASLPILTALVDKSLLRWEPSGRYHLHELLRQYAQEHLEQSPEEVAIVCDRHCAYYADFLGKWHADLKGGRQRVAAQAIAAELENIRIAWNWAVQHTRVDAIQQAADTLHYFYQFQSRYQEGVRAMASAAQALDKRELSGQEAATLAQLLTYQGWFCIRLGHFQTAKTVLQRSRVIYDWLGTPHPPFSAADPLVTLGTLANILGDYDEAEQLGEASRRINEALDDQANLMDSFYVLTNAAFARGQYETAQEYARLAYASAVVVNDRWVMAYILNDLGDIARALGNYGQAQQYYRASYAIREEFDDPEGMAVALNRLGEVAWLQQAYQEAEQLCQRSLTIYREIGDQGGLARSLNGLGNAACAREAYRTALSYFHEALSISAEIEYLPLTLSILVGIGDLLLGIGRVEQSVEVLALIRQHPASGRDVCERAEGLLARAGQQLPPKELADAFQRSEVGDLSATVTTVLTGLAALSAEEGEDGLRAVWPLATSHPTGLVEPLTPRELEVLRLLASGLSNQEIADRLVISVGTVKSYTHQIYSKLQVRNRTQAVLHSRQLNLLP
ncbi:MAG: tetratricopeptide repeat protein, partial [Chloroflexota bacterium]|nr:tetratricopeptide repeat protein [Chloroflexota bacterium]